MAPVTGERGAVVNCQVLGQGSGFFDAMEPVCRQEFTASRLPPTPPPHHLGGRVEGLG